MATWGRDNVLSSLDMAIDALNLAENVSRILPAKAVFGTVSSLLAMIRVCSLLSCDKVFQAHGWPGVDD